MTGWEPTSGWCWGGRPIARRVADCAPRRRAVLTGTIVSTETGMWRRTPAFIGELEDDSGLIAVVFSHHMAVPGMIKGALCTMEATVQSNGHRFFLWNPFYRFEP